MLFILVRIQLFMVDINVRYHWIREVLKVKLIELEKIHTDDNGANMLTKALPRETFEACCLIVNMANTPMSWEGEIF
ncbi:hypothetical protein ERO13_D10G207450v2 [Gossypium hirsutum]|uniref:Uncharacterized protein n=1 Tax=Gossypium darwinii TaxID=34276 RepID=A0A5D2B5L2_GOSDA|nr:hypothetical protein ERO13_D10G207450v2 [Gossypium hirsutum]TYG51373.1 hypothetical protein ES288_D10G252700v1 [Gossypium darwinii]